MKRFIEPGLVLTVAVACAAPIAGEARIKLTTLPVRESVSIQLENARATLVEEERLVPLVKGVNQVDFSWANTPIDPESIVFRVASAGDGSDGESEATVLSVSYPPGESALVWTVHAPRGGPARVRISYVLGALDKKFHYRAVASQDESVLTLSQYVRIRNRSREAFDGANLGLGEGRRFERPVGVNETRELLVARYAGVPVKKTYTVHPQEHGYLEPKRNKLRVAMHYVVENRRAPGAAAGFGALALPEGKVRIFQRDAHGGSAFLGEDWGGFTPREDEMRLFLGVARDIAVRREVDSNRRVRVSGDLYHQHVVLRFEMENFKQEPVTVDVTEDMVRLQAKVLGARGRDVQWDLGPETTFSHSPDPERTSAERLVVPVTLPGAEPGGVARKVVHKLHLVLHNEW